MPIERFAQIRAALVRSHDQDTVLAHFELTVAQWTSIAQQMSAIMIRSQPLRARFEQLYQAALGRPSAPA